MGWHVTGWALRAHCASCRQLHGVVVVDLAGLSLFSMRRGMPIIRYAAKTGLAFFPEGTMRVMVVNAPSVIAVMWSMVAPMLPEVTTSATHASTPLLALTSTYPLTLPHSGNAEEGGNPVGAALDCGTARHYRRARTSSFPRRHAAAGDACEVW